jgi:VIT1/CCC1 family predicted Fe2+/Mn2+ transporter
MMKHSMRVGLSFGVTSGIITTLGLMVGLHSGTHSKLVVIGGILTIAIADAFSDALGIHVSEEAENRHVSREIWEATISTFFFKFVFALSFLIPVLLFDLTKAILVSIIWGLFALCTLSFKIAKEQQSTTWKVVLEHLVIALIVISAAHYVGDWLAITFG